MSANLTIRPARARRFWRAGKKSRPVSFALVALARRVLHVQDNDFPREFIDVVVDEIWITRRDQAADLANPQQSPGIWENEKIL